MSSGRASPQRDPLSNRVIVVTGASAGVGRATAMAAARRGAAVALVARSRQALADVAEAIQQQGGTALVCPADVASADEVAAVADRVERELGPIDLWINAAMATVFSPVSALAADEVRRVTEVTYLGSVHGISVALSRMQKRGQGAIVQVGSALAFRGIPLQAPYCAAKHAVRGFISSLRSELTHEKSPITITEVHLPAVNTPQFTWARTRVAQQPRPVGKVYTPETAAEAILNAALKPRREYWLGGSTIQAILGQALAPVVMDRLMARQAWEGQFAGPAPTRDGNLYAPVEGLHAVRGPYAEEAVEGAVMVRGPGARITLALTGVGVGAVIGAGVTAMVQRMRAAR